MSIEAFANIVHSLAHSPVRNYATPGLTSKLLGEGKGKVRLFVSDRDTREWITPHSHRFDFACLVLAGKVEQILFTRCAPDGGNAYAIGTLKPVTGGLGKYEVVRDEAWGYFTETSRVYKAGDGYSMTSDEIHSIRFSRGAKVLFIEGPEVAAESVILEPCTTTGKLIQTFETKDWMFEKESA